MFSLLFTPLGRYAAIAAVVLSVLFGAYLKIKSDAVAEVEVRATEDVLRRTENAINAGDAVDVSSDGVRKPDAYTRDK